MGLELPLVVRDSEISTVTLSGIRALTMGRRRTRAIMLPPPGRPLQRGLDVRLVQLALSERGAAIRADGVFGRASADRVADHQRSIGAPVTGVVDPRWRSRWPGGSEFVARYVSATQLPATAFPRLGEFRRPGESAFWHIFSSSP